jgi:hypothetical protein
MNACRFLLPAMFVSTTVLIPVTGSIAKSQEATVQQSAGETSNPFVTPTTADTEPQVTNSPETIPAAPVDLPETVTPETIPAAPVDLPETVTPETVTPEIEIPEIIIAPLVEDVPTADRVQTAQTPIFFDAPAASQSDIRISKDKVAELRQARALYRANQRMARMEYNLWMGHQPLRPRWSPMPMMNSRYAPPTIIVPIFVNPR